MARICYGRMSKQTRTIISLRYSPMLSTAIVQDSVSRMVSTWCCTWRLWLFWGLTNRNNTFIEHISIRILGVLHLLKHCMAPTSKDSWRKLTTTIKTDNSSSTHPIGMVDFILFQPWNFGLEVLQMWQPLLLSGHNYISAKNVTEFTSLLFHWEMQRPMICCQASSLETVVLRMVWMKLTMPS